MSVRQFDNGYWYATELKAFAASLGIRRASALRKDELEAAIKRFLASGRVSAPAAPRRPSSAPRDVDLGLRPNLPVVVYTNDARTKQFLEREALKLSPGYTRRSGARYRLNRWREEQIANGVPITYGDVVREYVRLSLQAGRFARIPHGRYINFLSDYLASEPGATHASGVAAWKRLKRLDLPKTYAAWKNAPRRR
jgi:hypothetical protein